MPRAGAFAPDLPRWRPSRTCAIYRVAQESLTNVARHADASTVDVSLDAQGGAVLRVADDGRGVGAEAAGDPRARRDARAALLVGGRLAVRSRDGGGTEVRLAVPPGDGHR